MLFLDQIYNSCNKMVYFGPQINTWLRLIYTHPVGGGIPTRQISVELIF